MVARVRSGFVASSESFPPGGRAFRLEPDKVEAGWQKFLAAQNVAGQGVGTQISTAFITAFALLDFAIAPKGALVPLLLTRTVVVAGTVTFLLTRNYPVVVRHHFLATSLHAIWNACGIGLLIVFMGGFGSAYYPSIMLVMMGVSIIFVWPVRVAAVTHLCLTLAYVVPCALFGPARSAADVFGSSSIVLGTGLLGTLAQTLQYNAQRRLFSARSWR